jgi:hypothetical protein
MNIACGPPQTVGTSVAVGVTVTVGVNVGVDVDVDVNVTVGVAGRANGVNPVTAAQLRTNKGRKMTINKLDAFLFVKGMVLSFLLNNFNAGFVPTNIQFIHHLLIRAT